MATRQLVPVAIFIAGCAPQGASDGRSSTTVLPPGPEGIDRHPTLLADHQPGANDIAVDDRRVYWTNFVEDGAIRSVPLGGGEVTSLAQGVARPGRLCLDAEHVYWTSYTDGTVNRTPPAGGASAVVVAGQRGAAACARDGSRLVWTNFVDSGAVMGIDFDRSGIPFTLAAEQWRPNVVVLRDGEVYWIRSHPTAGAVLRLEPTGAVTALASAESDPYDVAVDDAHVYWTNRSNGTLRRVRRSGGAATTLVEGQLEPLGIALDERFVYWTSFRGGTVARTPLAGGEVNVVADGQGGPRRIAVDETTIYWTNYESGRVMSLAKP